MTSDPWGPLGLALRDFFNGDPAASVTLITEGREREPLPAAHFFRGEDDLPETEIAALDLCRGRVLDAGAGAGSHALILQERGLDVCALDISSMAVEIMKKRGVRDARRGDLFTLAGERFDTLLMLMNGVGVVETLDGFDRFLERAALLVPDGQVILDSTDMRKSHDAGERAALHQRRREGRYHGEVRFRMEYAGKPGPAFSWLFLDPDTLRERAAAQGWSTQIVFADARGEFVARLIREGQQPSSDPT